MKKDKYRTEAIKLIAELKNEAIRKGLTEQHLADLTGFAQPNIHRMLSGKFVPRLDNYLKLKAAINERV